MAIGFIFLLKIRIVQIAIGVVVAATIVGLADALFVDATLGSGSAAGGVLFVLIYAAVVGLCVDLYRRYRGRRRLRIRAFGQLLTLTPRGFEAAVADMLRDIG